jgi:hypothetical protein
MEGFRQTSSSGQDQGNGTNRERRESKVACDTARLLKYRGLLADMSFPPAVRTVVRPSAGVDGAGANGNMGVSG